MPSTLAVQLSWKHTSLKWPTISQVEWTHSLTRSQFSRITSNQNACCLSYSYLQK